MSTNLHAAGPGPGDPAGPGGAGANPHSPILAKQATVVQQELAKLYHECHQIEPDGPMCEAIQKLMSLVGEIARYFEHGPGAAAAGAAAGPGGPPSGVPSGPPPDMGPPPGAEGPPGPPMGGSPLQGPAAGLHAALLARAQGGQ